MIKEFYRVDNGKPRLLELDKAKIFVTDTVLNDILNSQDIMDKYNLNIKHLSDWWSSVYFERKEGV